MQEEIQKKESVEVINKAKRGDVFHVDPRAIIVIEGFNTRQDYGEIDELKESIIANGVKVPLRGYKEGESYYLNDGHRRLKAVMKAIEEGADIARVPFITEKKKTMEEQIFDILIFNDGKPLTPLELGETYKRLQVYGYNFTEIAKKIGKTVKHVSDMITVANSSKEIKDEINEGLVSATLVAEVKSVVKDDEKAETIIKEAVEKKKAATPEGEKTKVTKKDIDPKHTLQKKTGVFTAEQVRDILKAQLEDVAERLPEEFKQTVLETPLIL